MAWAPMPVYSNNRQVESHLSGIPTCRTADIETVASLRNILPSEYEFIFMDGLFPCEAAPGAAALFSGPYISWYSPPTTTRVAHAHREILAFVDKYGPFDGVMGFSQGAAVAASILLHHELDEVAPPWRFAIFVCAPLPFSSSVANGIDTRAAFGAPCVTWPVRPDCPDTVPSDLIPDLQYLRGEDHDSSDTAVTEHFYQMFHGAVDKVRISARTGHIIGAKDEWRRHSEELVQLCEKQSRTVLYHQSGHEIPDEYSEELSDLIETLAIESQP